MDPHRIQFARLAAFLIVSLALAGCLSDGSDGEEPGGPGRDGGSGGDPSPPGNDTPVVPLPPNGTIQWEEMQWSECEGFVSSFFWTGPHDIPEPPAGWEPGPRVVTDITMYGTRCERVSVGPFERGPIHSFIEFHDYQRTPDGCRQNFTTTTAFRTLNNIWIDDAEVASYLSEFHGMPTIVAEVNTSQQAVELGSEYVWRMRQPGGPWSELRILEPQEHDPNTLTMFRLFWFNDWFNETSVSYMEWGRKASADTSRYAMGEFHPPVLVADWHTDYRDTGSREYDQVASGEIRHFRDLFCQEPVGGSIDG